MLHATSNLTLLVLITLITFSEECKIMKLFMQFSLSSLNFFPFKTKYSQHLILKHPQSVVLP
jgi:hypothetical protein